MDGFERRKEQKRESIRRAATELFSSYGFSRVSLADIARRAHVSHVTIYNHFGSKDALVRDVIKEAISALVKRSQEIIKSDRPFLEKLERIILDKSEIASQYQGELLITAARDAPEMRAFIESLWQDEIAPQINELIDQGKKQGYIDRGLSSQAVAYYFAMLRQVAFSPPELLGDIRVDRKMARDLNSLFLFGLVRHPAEDPGAGRLKQ